MSPCVENLSQYPVTLFIRIENSISRGLPLKILLPWVREGQFEGARVHSVISKRDQSTMFDISDNVLIVSICVRERWVAAAQGGTHPLWYSQGLLCLLDGRSLATRVGHYIRTVAVNSPLSNWLANFVLHTAVRKGLRLLKGIRHRLAFFVWSWLAVPMFSCNIWSILSFWIWDSFSQDCSSCSFISLPSFLSPTTSRSALSVLTLETKSVLSRLNFLLTDL